MIRRLLSFVLLAALSTPAAAQVAGVTQIQNGGVTTYPNRQKLNFVGGGCVDNPVTAAKDCTIVSGGGTVTSITATANGGITATPNPIVAAGSLIVDQTSAFAPTWLGFHIFNLKITFAATSNQIGLGAAGHLVTISSTAPAAAAQTETIPDTNGNDIFAFLGQKQTYTKSQNVAAFADADAGSITTDASQGNTFTVTLGGNRTLANPTNLVSGGNYLWIVTQGGGGQTLAYGNLFKFSGGITPVLTTTASAVDMISCAYNGTILACVFTPDLR